MSSILIIKGKELGLGWKMLNYPVVTNDPDLQASKSVEAIWK